MSIYKKYEIDDIDDFLNEFLSKPKKQKDLIIDPELQNRSFKLNKSEYEQLKQSIITEGCKEPLITWNNILIDGFNRYQICKEFNIEFSTNKKKFNNKNEVLKYIDSNNLTKKYFSNYNIAKSIAKTKEIDLDYILLNVVSNFLNDFIQSHKK